METTEQTATTKDNGAENSTITIESKVEMAKSEDNVGEGIETSYFKKGDTVQFRVEREDDKDLWVPASVIYVGITSKFIRVKYTVDRHGAEPHTLESVVEECDYKDKISINSFDCEGDENAAQSEGNQGIMNSLKEQALNTIRSVTCFDPKLGADNYIMICWICNHIIADITCLISVSLTLSLADKYGEIDEELPVNVYGCKDSLEAISDGIAIAALIATIVSFITCTILYGTFIVVQSVTERKPILEVLEFNGYDRGWDKDARFNIGECCSLIIGLGWSVIITINIIFLSGNRENCGEYEDIQSDILVSILLLIPSMVKMVIFVLYLCCNLNRLCQSDDWD